MWHTLLETASAVQGEFLTRPNPKTGADGGVVGQPRRRVLTEFSSDQLAFALVWPAAKVPSYLLLAQDIIERLPAVFAALAAGRIDLPRAEAFSDALWGLSDDKARTIVDELLVKAEQWVPAILRERLRYKVLKADPSLARERYRHTVADRRAYLQPYSDGTAELGATNLPPDKASAAFNRVDRMARAAKHAGDLRNLGQLRADVILDLLSGRPFVSSPSLDNITAQADQANRDLGNDQTNDLRDDPNYQPDVKRRRGKLEPRKRSRATSDTDKPGDGGTGGRETDKAAGGDADRAGSGKPGNREADKTGNGKADPSGRGNSHNAGRANADQAGNRKADQAGNGKARPSPGPPRATHAQ